MASDTRSRLGPLDAAHAVGWAAILIALCAILIARGTSGAPRPLLTVLVSQTIIAIAAWRTALRRGLRLRDVIPLRRPTPRALAAAALFGIGAILISGSLTMRLARWLSAPGTPANQGLLALHASIGTVGLLLLLGVLVPLAEELLFRGVVLQGFLARFRPMTAISLSALLFALYHVEPISALVALLVGVLCGWAVHGSGSWWTGVGVHMTNNLIVVVSVLPAPELEPAPLGLPWALAGIALVAVGGCLLTGGDHRAA